MRIKPKLTKTIISFVCLSIFLLAVMYLPTTTFAWPPTTLDYVIFGIWLAMTIFFLFITIVYGYYEIQDEALMQRRFTKQIFYYYDEVVYIDEEWSRKNGTLLFIDKRGNKHYLIMDAKGILLEQMCKKCRHLLSEEQLSGKYPHVKL